MGLLGRRKASLKEVVAVLGIYCVIASTASQDSLYANNNLLDGPIKIANKKHINVADFTKDPSLEQDFPEVDILSHILPLVTFECKGKQPGYFADHKFRCEIFHFCKQDGSRSTYSCPFRSRFNQESGACEDEQTVQCNPLFSKKRVARQAIFQQSLPQNTRFIPGSNVLFVPQNPDTGFVRFLVPQQPQQQHHRQQQQPPQQQQQQQLFNVNVGSNSQFASSNGQPSQVAQVQQPRVNLIPSTNPIFLQSPSTLRAPSITLADNVQQSSARQGQVLLQQRPAQSGNQHRLPSSGLSLIRQDVPVARPQAATFQNQQSGLQSRPQQPAASFNNQQQQQQQRPPTGSTFSPQQRPQPQGANFGNQQRPPSTSFLSQPRQAPSQGPPQGFEQRRPPNPFDPGFFEDGFPGPSPFFEGGPHRFVSQNNRPQIENNNNFNVLGRPQTPEGFFFPQPQFQPNPNLDEGFFESDFPQLNLGPPQRPLQQPQPQNELRPQQHQVGTNFNLSPEDNAFINEIRFPGPPQGHVTVDAPREPTTGRPSESDRRPLNAPQRPNRPPQRQPDSGERGNAQFPSRFPPESQSSFGFQPQQGQRHPSQNNQPHQRPPPQNNQLPQPPRRDQRPSQHDQRRPQAQFPSGPFFEPPEVPQQPTRRPFTEAPSPSRRPIPTTDSAERAPTRPAPGTISQRRPQFGESTGHAQDDGRIPPNRGRPTVTSTPHSAPAPPSRGRGRFRPQHFDEFDLSDNGQDTPQRGPETEEDAPHRPVSAEAFGIPAPSDDFGSREPQFQSSPDRRPGPSQRRPPTSQLFSSNPSRPVELSTPPTVPLRRPSTEQTFTQQPSSGQRFRPNHQFDSSSEGGHRGQENHRGQAEQAPTRQPDRRFPSRHQSESSTEGVQRDPQGHRGQRPFHFEKPSTEVPNDFSSQEPTFPTSIGTSSEVPDRGNDRPGPGQHNQFFSPNQNNFGSFGSSDENVRRPFTHSTESDRGHPGQSDSISSTQPSSQGNFNPFHRPNEGPNFAPTFSDASIPSAPTFGPQSVDQLAPPELASFTARPDTTSRIPEPTEATEETPRGHVQRGRHPTTSNPRQFAATHQEDGLTPADARTSTELSATKRGRRPGGVSTSAAGKGVRTRPTRKRGRGRRPTTTEATVDISNDVTTTAKPRRRIRPSSGAIRKRPIAQRTRSQITSTTEAPKASLVEDSTAGSVPKRRPVSKRVQAGQRGDSRAVVRKRRPVTTTAASNDFPGTVDHSASNTREHLSSDSTNRKVSVISKFDAIQDSAISASHERFAVTKPDFQVSPETSSIKDHSSMDTSTEAIEDHSTSSSPASTTASTTTTTSTRPETTAINEISSPSSVTVTKVTTTSSTSSSADSQPEALTKLKLLLNRKFILKLTTEAPSS